MCLLDPNTTVFGAKPLKRKTAMAASELAQAEPLFDEGGYSGGKQSETTRSGGDAIAFAPPKAFLLIRRRVEVFRVQIRPQSRE